MCPRREALDKGKWFVCVFYLACPPGSPVKQGEARQCAGFVSSRVVQERENDLSSAREWHFFVCVRVGFVGRTRVSVSCVFCCLA